MAKKQASDAAVLGAVLGVLAVVLVVGVFGTRAFFMHRVRSEIRQSRAPTMDASCTARGKAQYAWTYAGGTSTGRDAVADADGCSPLEMLDDPRGVYCCPPR